MVNKDLVDKIVKKLEGYGYEKCPKNLIPCFKGLRTLDPVMIKDNVGVTFTSHNGFMVQVRFRIGEECVAKKSAGVMWPLAQVLVKDEFDIKMLEKILQYTKTKP